ncbi:MAG: DEAD/DEAH box helicase family protein [Gemmatimonadota bacterium]|nr:MAG: DEAD/DEAH box helicase family protein [Gemmatimonadota bacterium]
MSGRRNPIPTLCAGTESARVVLDLWTAAARVDVALAEPAALLRLVDLRQQSLDQVRLVSPQPPPAGCAWLWTTLDREPTPQFMLFYGNTVTFPESALILTGGLENGCWITCHRRPLVLQRLRERFDQLLSLGTPAAALSAIREQPHDRIRLANSTSGSLGFPGRIASPSQLYRQILAAHFDAPDRTASGHRPLAAPMLAAHQERASERAADILDRYSGVIIADALGLGKTYIGLRLLEATLQNGGRGLVIAPAALRGQWSRELAYLLGEPGANHGTTRDDPAGNANLELHLLQQNRPPVSLLSTESLGRRTFDLAPYEAADLVIIDEAHNFRNPTTRRYRRLGHLLRLAKAVLLTATPFNNTFQDLQHLIDLFAAPGAFRHLGITDYREIFRRGDGDDGNLQRIVAACVVRRTRRFLRAHYGDIQLIQASGEISKLRFPKRHPAVDIQYDLEGTYGGLLEGLHDWLEALQFPSLHTSTPSSDLGGLDEGVATLLKMILLKRLESSVQALRRTVIQQSAWCDTALRALRAGRILTRPDYRASFRNPGDDLGTQLAFFELILPPPSAAPERLHELATIIDRDLEVLTDLKAALAAITPQQDRKLLKLFELIDGPLAGRKTLIFTEFRDTARYLHRQLLDRPYVARIDSAAAYLGNLRASRDEVIARFAPLSNGLSRPPDRERVDILVATDVLSEGLNLQDAAAVVSYDLPWNPVRLMQRVGRVDRLGAIEPSISILHFVPTSVLEHLLGLVARLHRKISTISSTLGVDGPILGTPEGSPQALRQIRLLTSRPDGYDRLEQEGDGFVDPEEQAYLDSIASFAENAPEPAAQPAVCAVVDETSPSTYSVAYWRLISGRQRRGLWLVYRSSTRRVSEDALTAIDALRRSAAREVRPVPLDLAAEARRAFQSYANAVLARLETACIAGDALNPSLPQCRIAAWLARYLEGQAPRMTREQRAHIDRLLDRLSQRFTLASERDLTRLAANLPPRPDAGALAQVERLLESFNRDTNGPAKTDEVGTLLVCGRDTG